MNAYDPGELVARCERLISSGEISNIDLYELAEWLNAHREACFHWPGDCLSKALQEVWADGKINKTELRKMSRLLLKIQKEWFEAKNDEAFGEGMELAEAAVRHFDLCQAKLPSIPIRVRIKSHSEKGAFYEVDLSSPSCTCPDWRSQRRHLDAGHLGRCCKHVLEAFGGVEPQNRWPGWFGEFVEVAYSPHPAKQWVVIMPRKKPVLISSAHGGWADVFAHSGEGYERFGYNIAEDRWAYGMEPRDFEEIRSVIFEITL